MWTNTCVGRRHAFYRAPDRLTSRDCVFADLDGDPFARRAFALTRSGFQTVPTRRAEERDEEEGDIQDDTSSGAAGGAGRVSLSFGARARASMIPRTPVRSSTSDDLQAMLQPPDSFGVKFFEVAVLLAVFNACWPVKDAGDLVILRQTFLETWVRFPNKRNQEKQTHPVLKYRIPHGVPVRDGPTRQHPPPSSYLIAYVLHCPSSPPHTAL